MEVPYIQICPIYGKIVWIFYGLESLSLFCKKPISQIEHFDWLIAKLVLLLAISQSKCSKFEEFVLTKFALSFGHFDFHIFDLFRS